jgi:hypothetical protein
MDTNEVIGAIRGPVIMIAVGSLFAVDHFTPYGFNRTWPVLLIVIGALSLIGHGNRTLSGGAK